MIWNQLCEIVRLAWLNWWEDALFALLISLMLVWALVRARERGEFE